MLDPRRLQALHAVATTGSVKEAATQLGYSSSAISQQITALERETGSVLLEPAGRGVRPTPAGELLAQHAERIFEQLAQAESELIALNAGQLGSLRLASFASAGAELIPPALAQVRAELPALDVTLRNTDPEEALALLRRGLVDVALIERHGPLVDDDGLAYHPLLRVIGQSVGVDQRAVALDHRDVDEAAAQERERLLGIGVAQRDLERGQLRPDLRQAGGMSSAPAEANDAKRRLPSWPALSAISSDSAWASCSKIRSACWARSSPAGVGRTPRPAGSSSTEPVSRSSAVICWLIAEDE